MVQTETDECINDPISEKVAEIEPEKAENLQENQEIVLDNRDTLPKENEMVELQETLVPAQTEKPILKGDNSQSSSHANAGQEPVITKPVTPENRIDIQCDADMEGFTT
ncbi:43287_t:CDS:1, partial [Gigaspora margarita]